MGLYSSVRPECPYCHEGYLEYQTNKFPGECDTYYFLPEVPVEVAKDIDGKISWCSECHKEVRIKSEIFWSISLEKED